MKRKKKKKATHYGTTPQRHRQPACQTGSLKHKYWEILPQLPSLLSLYDQSTSHSPTAALVCIVPDTLLDFQVIPFFTLSNSSSLALSEGSWRHFTAGSRCSQKIWEVNKCSIRNNLLFPTLPLSQKSKLMLGFSIWGNPSWIQWKSKPTKASDLIKDAKAL